MNLETFFLLTLSQTVSILTAVYILTRIDNINRKK